MRDQSPDEDRKLAGSKQPQCEGCRQDGSARCALDLNEDAIS